MNNSFFSLQNLFYCWRGESGRVEYLMQLRQSQCSSNWFFRPCNRTCLSDSFLLINWVFSVINCVILSFPYHTWANKWILKYVSHFNKTKCILCLKNSCWAESFVIFSMAKTFLFNFHWKSFDEKVWQKMK